MSDGIRRTCPVCEAGESKQWLRKGELQLVRCTRCGMVYADPVAPEFASGAYYDQAGTDYYLSPAKLQSDYADVRFERELNLFRQYCPGGRVLDVGCSSGAFLFHLNRRYPGRYVSLGTDVSGPPLDYAESRGVQVVRGNFLDHDFQAKQFDVITFWAVLEHLLEPKRFVDKAFALLRPGGLCFVLVPNIRSLAVSLLGGRYRYIYPQHLNYFGQTTLRRLVAPPFRVLATKSMHFNPVVIWQDWRRKGREVSNAERAELLQRTTNLKNNALLRPVKWGYRGVEIALGKLGLADNLAMVLQRDLDSKA